jgi:peptidyl-prolyl cis-trans isomerase C
MAYRGGRGSTGLAREEREFSMNSGFRYSGLPAAVALAAAIVLGGAGGAAAAEGGEAKDPIVASVNGENIYASDITEAQAQLPPEYRQIPPAVLFGLLMDALIDTKLAVARAQREGFDEEPGVARRLTRARNQILQRAYLEARIEDRMNEEAMKRGYEKFVAELKGGDEVRASHILVETEAQAKELIAELAGGADFFELAKSKSIGPTADKGGDLGFFDRDGMLAEFSDAAFMLEIDETTPTPVRTQYGWHVIRVVERRKARPPMFVEVEAEVREMVTRDLGAEIIKSLRAEAEIKRFGPDGSVIEDAPK